MKLTVRTERQRRDGFLFLDLKDLLRLVTNPHELQHIFGGHKGK